jgi:hypothetical protein
MLVRRLNLAWKSGHPNQCLRLGDDAKEIERSVGAFVKVRATAASPSKK